MLTRTRFYNLMGGPYGYSLYSNRLVDEMAKTDILIVPEDVDIRLLGRRAMQRAPEDLYDPVLVAGPNGGIKGTLTMKEVLTQAIEYEVRVASCSNPLTGLPGNMMIQGWLRDAFAHAPFAIAYVDLDHFKEYNDTYGFSKGDEMIGLCARLLVEAFAGARIGHLGGDDFVVVFDGDVSRSSLARLCEKFDAAKLSLFTAEDTARGWYEAIDRTGKRARVAPVTLSVAVITSDKLPVDIHAGRLSRIIASLKTQAKAQNLKRGRSGYLFERRTHKPEVAVTRTAERLAGDLPA